MDRVTGLFEKVITDKLGPSAHVTAFLEGH